MQYRLQMCLTVCVWGSNYEQDNVNIVLQFSLILYQSTNINFSFAYLNVIAIPFALRTIRFQLHAHKTRAPGLYKFDT